jgi:hypothetical protein
MAALGVPHQLLLNTDGCSAQEYGLTVHLKADLLASGLKLPPRPTYGRSVARPQVVALAAWERKRQSEPS